MRSIDVCWLHMREIALMQQRGGAAHEEVIELQRVVAPFRPDPERDAV